MGTGEDAQQKAQSAQYDVTGAKDKVKETAKDADDTAKGGGSGGGSVGE